MIFNSVLKRTVQFHQQKEIITFIKAGLVKGIMVKEEYNIFYKKKDIKMIDVGIYTESIKQRNKKPHRNA
jgi:hypothetical protein